LDDAGRQWLQLREARPSAPSRLVVFFFHPFRRQQPAYLFLDLGALVIALGD